MISDCTFRFDICEHTPGRTETSAVEPTLLQSIYIYLNIYIYSLCVKFCVVYIDDLT